MEVPKVAPTAEVKAARAEKGRPSKAAMTLTVRVKRFDPTKDARPRFDEYQVPADPMDRALDLLMYIKWHLDGTLTFRKSSAGPMR